jgi:hypothetical protein
MNENVSQKESDFLATSSIAKRAVHAAMFPLSMTYRRTGRNGSTMGIAPLVRENSEKEAHEMTMRSLTMRVAFRGGREWRRGSGRTGNVT